MEALLDLRPHNSQEASLVKVEETTKSMLVTLIQESRIQCYFNFSNRSFLQFMRPRLFVILSRDSPKDTALLNLALRKSQKEPSKKCKAKFYVDAP